VVSEDALSVSQHGTATTAQPVAGQPVFYFDLGSPEAYLTAERVMAALPVVPEWVPILAPTDAGDRVDRDVIARRVAERGLQPLRWPAGFPVDTRLAMLACTYAKQIGRTVPFSLAAFRQAYAGGRSLADEATILIAGAACEMHPTATLKALATRGVASKLERATEAALAAGVHTVPALRVGDQLFHGDDGVEAAGTALARRERGGGR
jgi:2-hydroxychromene-2-carboxylate isomerase